jgi:hypothetical protein
MSHPPVPAEITATIAAVRSLYQTTFQRECYFHLSPCARCGAPVWQEPCPVCDFYLDWDYPQTRAATWADEQRRHACTAERYAALIAHHGSVVVWYFVELRHTVAYRADVIWRAKLDRTIEAARVLPAPPADLIWAALGPAAQETCAS